MQTILTQKNVNDPAEVGTRGRVAMTVFPVSNKHRTKKKNNHETLMHDDLALLVGTLKRFVDSSEESSRSKAPPSQPELLTSWNIGEDCGGGATLTPTVTTTEANAHRQTPQGEHPAPYSTPPLSVSFAG